MFALVLAVLTVLPAVLAPPATATTAPGTFGVNPGDLFGLPQAEWDTHLTAMSIVWIMRGFAGIAPPAARAICAAASATVAARPTTRPGARQLRLRLLLRQDPARPERLVVATRCGVRCALRVELLEPVRATQAAHHASGYRTRRSVALNLGRYAPGSRVKVKVTATARDGHAVRMFKTLGLR